MSIRDFLFDRRVAFVQRWHARQTIGSETLAEHQYFVARDALLIATALHHYGIAKPLISECVARALVHDEVEKVTGDVSGEAKRAFPAMKEMLSQVEYSIINGPLYAMLPKAMGDTYRALTTNAMTHHDLEGQIVKYADKVEAYLFSVTEAAHNSLFIPVVQQIAGELEELQWPWLISLRQETGVP